MRTPGVYNFNLRDFNVLFPITLKIGLIITLKKCFLLGMEILACLIGMVFAADTLEH